jgi:hypothetical protein
MRIDLPDLFSKALGIKTYQPVFAGFTPEGKKVVLYKHRARETELHIRTPDGKLWALSPGSKTFMRFDQFTELLVLKVETPQWTGVAKGSRYDLVMEEAI